jgi:hypothetical protein
VPSSCQSYLAPKCGAPSAKSNCVASSSSLYPPNFDRLPRTLARKSFYIIAHSWGLCQGVRQKVGFEFKIGVKASEDAKTGCRMPSPIPLDTCIIRYFLCPRSAPIAQGVLPLGASETRFRFVSAQGAPPALKIRRAKSGQATCFQPSASTLTSAVGGYSPSGRGFLLGD